MPMFTRRLILPFSLGLVAGACADPTPPTLNQKCFHHEDCDDGQFCERAEGKPDGLCREGDVPDDAGSDDGVAGTTGGSDGEPSGDTDPTSTSNGTGNPVTDSATAGSSGDQGTTGDDTDSDDSDGSTDSTSGSTGSDPACADGAVDEGELCFDNPVTVASESTVRGVDAADIDGDGHIDIAAVYHPGNGLGAARIAMGEGDGSFAPAQPVSLGTGGYERVVLAPFGDLDVDMCAVDTLQNEISCVRGDGNGGFRNVSTHSGGSFDLLLVDLNGDGDLDLLTPNSEFMQGYTGDNETFPPTASWLDEDNVQFPIVGMEHAQLGGGGLPDIIVATPNQSRVRILHTDGGPGNPFTTPTILNIPGEAPVDVAVGDFNGDGDLDVAAAVEGGVRVWINTNGNGVDFDAPTLHDVDPGTVGVKAGDFNNDGLDDIVSANTSGTVSVVLSVDGTMFDPQVSIPMPGTPYDLAVADFNEDGSPDIVVADGNAARVLLSNP